MKRANTKQILLAATAFALAAPSVAFAQDSIDLEIAKDDLQDPVTTGNPLDYTVTVTNNGPGDAVNVVVYETMPPEIIDVLATSGCLEDPNGLPTCTLGAIASGDSASFVIEAISPLDPGIITNTASTADTATTTVDTDDMNNMVSEQTTVILTGSNGGSSSNALEGEAGGCNHTGTGSGLPLAALALLGAFLVFRRRS